MQRAPSIDEALPSSSSRTPAMSRAHSLHSSASGLNAAGPSHHEHLVGPHHCTPTLYRASATSLLSTSVSIDKQCLVTMTLASSYPCTPTLHHAPVPLLCKARHPISASHPSDNPAPYLYIQPAHTGQALQQALGSHHLLYTQQHMLGMTACFASC